MEETEHLLGDVLHGKAELLVEHLIWSGCTKVVEAEHHSITSYHTAERGGEAGCETEYGHTFGNNAQALILVLLLEHADGRHGHHTARHAAGLKLYSHFA